MKKGSNHVKWENMPAEQRKLARRERRVGQWPDVIMPFIHPTWMLGFLVLGNRVAIYFYS